MKQHYIKCGAIGLGLVALVCGIVMLVCNAVIINGTAQNAYDTIYAVPNHKYGLLLGTTPQTRIGRKKNQFFTYRIEAAVAAYKSGRIKYVLISGDAHSLDGVNEVTVMRDSLVAHGIPKEKIILDGMGYRTLDSVVRTVKTYGIRDFLIISQRFHNERALYLANHSGLGEISVDAYNAKDSTTKRAIIIKVRECFARVKVFVDIFTNKQPSSLYRY